MEELISMVNEAEFAEAIQQANATLATPQAQDIFVEHGGVIAVRNLLKKFSSSSRAANLVAVLSLIQTCALNGIVIVFVIDMLLKIHSSIFLLGFLCLLIVWL